MGSGRDGEAGWVDKWLFGTVLMLVLFGLVMVFSASAVMAKETLDRRMHCVEAGGVGSAGNGRTDRADAGGLQAL